MQLRFPLWDRWHLWWRRILRMASVLITPRRIRNIHQSMVNGGGRWAGRGELDGKKWTHRQFGAVGELGFGIILDLV
eukprot:COSAG01_NODE_222_length_21420_cov_30.616763_3_plen_77_part_00